MGECERGRLDELECAGVGENKNKSVGMRLWESGRVGERVCGKVGKCDSASAGAWCESASARVESARVEECESGRVRACVRV